MQERVKLDIYLDAYQYKKLCAVAAQLHKSPEEVANNVVTGYISMLDPVPPDAKPETIDE